ncbi:MAG TPA: hypothetical protein VE220_04535 [Gaiellaceae bacterium]|nr:hypothetical protein [Gaiellaceae bacterium]
MAVTDEKDGALATAAVAAAAGAAVYGLRKALASSGSGTSSLVPGRGDGHEDDDDDGEDGDGGGGSRGGSLVSTVLESASSSLLPLAEEAADAVGKWTAENAPDVIRDRIVPRFIESFNDAA